MASLLQIIKLGSNKILEQPARKVETFNFNNELEVLVANMFLTMYNAKGVGLAAPQIGVPSRIAVIDISCGQDEDSKLILINPLITERRGEMTVEEGCLSIPNRKETIKRSAEVVVQAQNLNGEVFTVYGRGLLSQALQHECDHLNGVIFLKYVEK